MSRVILPSETLSDRLQHVLDHSGGVMPMGMVVRNDQEKAEAEHLLEQIDPSAARLIYVTTETEAEEKWRTVVASTMRPKPKRVHL